MGCFPFTAVPDIAGVDILTFGQYLQPTPLHLSVKEYVTPEKFEHWRTYGEDVIGFRCACRKWLQGAM